MLASAKSKYFHTQIADSAKDTKSLYCMMHSLIGRQKSSNLPKIGSLEEVTNAFSKFFDNKIQVIREKLDKAGSEVSHSAADNSPPSHNCRLSTFEVASES